MDITDIIARWDQPGPAPLVQRNSNLSSVLINGTEQNSSGRTFGQLMASLAFSAIAFGIQFLLFNLLRKRLKRIYFPKTYMVPEKERVAEPRGGAFGWFVSVMKTSNSDFINKCGLDAYFYLRYLRMLLKLFTPLALIFIPVLLPVNHVGIHDSNARGIDQFAWQNITRTHTNRLWVHLTAAVSLVVWFSYVVYQELRGYIRIRQAYLTSPQHRIRASATTVLVTNIPRKWLTREELDALYDVFPGGVRNIWINRNYDELDSLIQTRDNYASTLEGLYADLLKKAQNKYIEQKKKNPAQAQPVHDDEERPGMSIGNPHQIPQNLDEALGRVGSSSEEEEDKPPESSSKRDFPFIPGVVSGLGAVGQGIGAVGHGVGHGVGKLGHFVRDLGRDRKDPGEEATPSDSKRETSPRTSSPLDGADFEDPPQSPMYSAEGEMTASIKSKPVEGEIDEIPLREIRTTGPSVETHDSAQKAAKIDPPAKKGFFSFLAGIFSNSLEEDMPNTADYLEMTKAATRRRREILKEQEPVWSQWLPEKERDTTHVHTKAWINWIPYTGTKVDAIDYYTVLLATYNETIERLQQDPDRFPLMNSAFIQFNHQVAAHMACQSVNHHMPMQMAPRTVEISPEDVHWDHLSISWWMRYFRTALVLVIVIGLIILWAPLVTLSSLIGQLSYLSSLAKFLNFVNSWPGWLVSAIQGILPPVLLGVLFLLLPIIFRALTRLQGVTTGQQSELSVQNYFFTFLFIQLFVVVTIAGAVASVAKQITSNVTSIPSILAQKLPIASNYFISYIILQAFSVSAGALLQIGSLLVNLLWAKIVDSTPRSVFSRATSLPEIQWGSFFPIYTNLAVIGLVYSVVAPLILVFNLCTFTLFWVAHRYNALFVNRYRLDTGGLLFPRAVNQLFVGIYTMELCLVGLFFLQRNAEGKVACAPQAIIMLVLLGLTAVYQVLLNRAFSPLFRYIPITLEDDAVRRDEEFAAMQAKRFAGEDPNDYPLADEEKEGDNLQEVLKEREEREEQESKLIEAKEREKIEARRQARSRSRGRALDDADGQERAPSSLRPQMKQRESSGSQRASWANREQKRRSVMFDPEEGPLAEIPHPPPQHRRRRLHTQAVKAAITGANPTDVEKQQVIDDSFFFGINDELEDLTQEERDILVNKAFKHRAARATRPAIWIPKDRAGVSEFEIGIIDKDPVFRKYIWISDEGAWLNEKGKVDKTRMRRPPDFNEENLVVL